MQFYIQDAERLNSFQTIDTPPQSEIQAAARVLAHNPVVGSLLFSIEVVELVGKYRELLAPRRLTHRIDDFWNAIVSGEWYAWLVAIHEAAEIDALARRGINPFDSRQFNAFNTFNNPDFAAAHVEASLIELQYIQEWAKQLQRATSLVAIALQHPINRSLNPNYHQFVKTLQTREGWPDPTQEELNAATEVWNAVRRRQITP